MPGRPPAGYDEETIRREAMAFARIGLFRIRRDGTLLFIDDGTLRILGLHDRYPDPAVLVGQNVASLFRYEGPPGTFRERTFEQGELRNFEYRFRTLDDEERRVLHSSYVVPDPASGEPVIQVVAVDVTELRRAEEALARSEARATALLRAIPDLMFRLTRDGTYLEYVSEREEDLFVAPERLLGANLRDVLPPAVAEEAVDAIGRSLETGSVVSFEYTLPFDVGERTFEARIVPSGADEVLAIVRDVTELRRAEQERLRLVERAQRTQRLESLGILAGGIAHDFNNLLTGILAGAELVLGELPEGAPARERVAQIHAGARRAADLTAELLAYSGRGRFVVERVDLSSLVREMVSLLETSMSRTASLSLRLDPEPLPVEGDTTQIRQVVMNLITNASDALGERPGEIAIETGRRSVGPAESGVDGAPAISGGGEGAGGGAGDDGGDARGGWRPLPGDYAYVAVADSGCGMDGATLGRIFDPFFSTKFAGRGLGLAAVEGIVRSHAGAILVRSGLGRGTRFTVLLPLAAALVAPSVEPALPAPAPAPSRRATVLVVDDEPAVRDVSRVILERAGFLVELAADGQEAVERFAAAPRRYDVVLLDMTMPRLTGVEAFRELRRLRADVRVVLTSGFAEQDAIERFGEAGLRGFVQKPFAPAALVARLRAALAD